MLANGSADKPVDLAIVGPTLTVSIGIFDETFKVLKTNAINSNFECDEFKRNKNTTKTFYLSFKLVR